MKRIYIKAIFLFAASLLLTACSDSDTYENSDSTTSESSEIVISDSDSNETKEQETPNWGTNINIYQSKYDDDGTLLLGTITDDIVCDGNELDYYAEFELDYLYADGTAYDTEVNSLVLFLSDGYLIEASIDGGESALVNELTFNANEMTRINFKCAPICYTDSDTHYLVCVIVPHYDLAEEEIPAVMLEAIERQQEIKFEDDEVSDFDTVEMTALERSDNYYQDSLELSCDGSDLTLICNDPGTSYCYLFCDGELMEQDGSYIFKSENTEDTYSEIVFEDIDTDKVYTAIRYNADDFFEIEKSINYKYSD